MSTDARRVLEELERSGVSIDAITEELVEDGVKQFADAADKLYGAVAEQAAHRARARDRPPAALARRRPRQGGGQEHRGMARVGKDPRLWQRDTSVWTDTDEDKWLGWLDSAAKADVADYEDFADRVKGQKFSDAVLLGMGGSSLGPEVLAETFARKPGFPKLARARLHRSGADPGDGGQDRPRQHPVHRVEQIRRHDRAEHL